MFSPAEQLYLIHPSSQSFYTLRWRFESTTLYISSVLTKFLHSVNKRFSLSEIFYSKPQSDTPITIFLLTSKYFRDFGPTLKKISKKNKYFDKFLST